MTAPNVPQRIVLVVAAVAVLALAFYPPFFPHNVRRWRFDIELAAVTLATVALVLALRGLPKLSLAPGGWKRLWIVLSLIYLAVVVGVAWHLYPSHGRFFIPPSDAGEQRALAGEQRAFVITAAFWGVGPVAAVYLLGVAGCWVYRGFRPVRKEG